MIRKLPDAGALGWLTWAALGRLAFGVLIAGAVAGASLEYFDGWDGHVRPNAGSYAIRITGAILGLALGTLACSLVARRFDFLVMLWGMTAGLMSVNHRSSIVLSAVAAMLLGAFAGWLARLYHHSNERQSDCG